MDLTRLFYNPSIDDPNIAWKSYINLQSSLDDVVTEIKSLNKQHSRIDTRNFEDYITSNNEIVGQTNQILQTTFDSIDNLHNDFYEVSSKLEDIEQNLIDLSQIIDYKLTTIIEQNKITNFLLNHITYLLKLPDSEKEKNRNIEVGLKHFKNANYEKSLYKDSLVFFEKAKKIDHTDFITLYYIGMIHLYGDECINLSDALKYFIQAGKYSEVESNEYASKLIMLLKYSTDKEINENISSSEYLKKFAAESYYQASIASFALSDFLSSKSYAKKAIDLNSNFQIAHILYCRAMIKDNDAYSAIKYLSKYLLRNPIVYEIISSDPVFYENNDVAYFIKKIKEDIRDKVLSIINTLKELKVTKQTGKRANWIYESPWIDEYIRALEFFNSGSFKDLINSYNLFYNRDIRNLPIPWYFDSNQMYFNKSLVRYASSLNLKYLILSINNYISIFKDGELTKSIISHKDFIKDIYITNDDKYFFTCGLDKSIQLYDLAVGLPLKKFTFESGISRIVVSNNMKKLAFFDGNSIQIYNIDFQNPLFDKTSTLNNVALYHCNLDFSPNNNYLSYFDSRNFKIIVWDIIQNEIYKEIDCLEISKTFTFLARSVKFSNNNELIAIADEKGTIINYNLLNDQYFILGQTGYAITKLFFTEDDSFIVSDSNEEIITWDIKSKQIISRLDGYNNFIYGIKGDSIIHENIDLFNNSFKNLVQYINFDLALMYGRIKLKMQK